MSFHSQQLNSRKKPKTKLSHAKVSNEIQLTLPNSIFKEGRVFIKSGSVSNSGKSASSDKHHANIELRTGKEKHKRHWIALDADWDKHQKSCWKLKFLGKIKKLSIFACLQEVWGIKFRNFYLNAKKKTKDWVSIFFPKGLLHVKNRIREQKPSIVFKFSSKTGAHRNTECQVVERRL